MPTSHTVVTIYNRALDHIVENPLHTPDDGNAYSRWLNRNFAPVVEAALRQQPWNFACSFWVPTENADAPLFRWRRGYDLPNGWVRVLPPTHNGYRDGRVLDHAIQGNTLLTNEEVRVGVELVMNKQNPGEWDPLFAEMIAGRLATGMAHRFTGKTSFVDRCKQIAEEAYQQAEMINAFEGTIARPDQYDILRARDGGITRDGYEGEYRW